MITGAVVEPLRILPVLFRSKSLVVVDKPAGLPVEADGPDSVVKVLARQLAPPSGGRAWPRVVHRLDRDTSGCLAIALDQAGERALQLAFDNGEVDKSYLALVRGAPPDSAALDTAYGPDPADRRRHTTRIDTPRRARLHYETKERFCVGTPAECALLAVVLDTGRTHQIRVQLSESGLPILGDELYGVPPAQLDETLRSVLTRPGLHAARLALPGTNDEAIDCTAPLAADLEAVLARLRSRP